MQAITTKFKTSASGQGRIYVKSQYGNIRVLSDDALNSEQNHRAAAVEMLKAIKKMRDVDWMITASAPLPDKDGGWTFLIDRVPEVMPLYMSVTVRFMPGTNTGPAYMKVFSWLFPKGLRVNYSRDIDPTDTQQAARLAAGIMLTLINAKTKLSGLEGYRINEYIQAYNGDRVFSLRYL